MLLTCDGVAQVHAQRGRPNLRAQSRNWQEAQAAEDDKEGCVRDMGRVCEHHLHSTFESVLVC